MENMGPLLIPTTLVNIHKNDDNVKDVIVVLLVYICPFHDVHCMPPMSTFWNKIIQFVSIAIYNYPWL
jgi:hypothetical protein